MSNEKLAPAKDKDIWFCKIGFAGALPRGADGPMRDAVYDAYQQLTGHPPDFIFSGWGQTLSEGELAVVGGGPHHNQSALMHGRRTMKDDKLAELSAKATQETARLRRKLDITNTDHVTLWIEANTIPDEPMNQCASWLACRIVEAHEAAINDARAIPSEPSAAMVEAVARAMEPGIWSKNENDAHRAASPHSVEFARQRSCKEARRVAVAVLAHLREAKP